MSASRVQLSAYANGTIWSVSAVGSVLSPAGGATALIYLHDPTSTLWGGVNTPIAATVFVAETGSPSLSNPLTANSNGQLPGWVAANQDLDIVASYRGVVAPVATLAPVVASAKITNLGNVTTTATLDLAGSVNRTFIIMLTASSCALSVINAVVGSQLDIIPFQDANPPRAVTHPTAVTWTSEGVPVLSAGANNPDRFSYTVVTVDGSGNPTKMVGSLGSLGSSPQTSPPVAVNVPILF